MSKYSIEEVKKLSPKKLLDLINGAKEYLKTNAVFADMCKNYNVEPSIIDLIPVRFGDLPVSARTAKGVITLNYQLLCDGDFFKDYMYLCHECEHYFQQCLGDKPTQGADDGNYLDNPYEIDAFKRQVEYLSDEFGKDEANNYVEHLLDHHNVDEKKEREDKKEELLSTAQYTELDKARHYNSYFNYYDEEAQKILPPFSQEWNTNYEIRDSHRKIREKEREEKNKPKALDLNFPELGIEHIKYKNLSPEQIAKIEEDNKNNSWKIEEINKLKELNQNLIPDDVRKIILKKYNQFRSVSVEFYAKYREANELAAEVVTLDKNGTYLEIIKRLPEFLSNLIKKQIGVLFGATIGRRRYYQSQNAESLQLFLQRGVNLFSITPQNYEEKLEELRTATFNMKTILVEYEKRKKLLVKLPQKLQVASKEFLSSRKLREFLRWLDEYFPNDRENFIDECIKNIYDDTLRSKSQDYDNFELGDLRRIKSYLNIYNKAISNTTTGVENFIIYKTKGALETRLQDELGNKLKSKLNFIRRLLTDGNYKELFKYVNKNFKLDLTSIFNFTNNVLDRMNQYDEDVVSEEQSQKIRTVKKEKFLTEFEHLLIRDIDNIFSSEYNSRNRTIEAVKRFYGKYSRYAQDGTSIFKELEKLTEKDVDNLLSSIVREIIVNSIPNFSSGYYNNKEFPNFSQLGSLIKETGKFSVDAIMTYIQDAAPFLPKDFILQLSRALFKGGESNSILNMNSTFTQIRNLKDPSSVFVLKLIIDILEKSGKMNSNTFASVFFNNFEQIRGGIRKLQNALSAASNKEKARQIFIAAIRNTATIDQDIKNLTEFLEFAHNEAGDLTDKDLISIMQNKNFTAFSKVGIVKKLIKCYASLKDLGSMSGIKKKYGRAITQLMKHNYISDKFYENVQMVLGFFGTNNVISPASENFRTLFDTCSAVETDLEIMEMAATFSELLKDYEPKNENLFKLDLAVNDRLRFRVLKDKDPRILRIGVETGCCMRINGVGESAARDAFVNPLAGVVILEWKDENSNWEILTQSYFHYVPEDKSYILDNVEYNRDNVNKSGINLEATYAFLADYAKQKLDVNYFLAGKGYSKINTSDFETGRTKESTDPRYFSPKALEKNGYRSSVYTDFNPSNAIDLLKPNENTVEKMRELVGLLPENKKAFEINLRKIILGSGSLS